MKEMKQLIASGVQRVVAMEVSGDQALLFVRGGGQDDGVECQRLPFKPWLLTAGGALGASVEGNCGVEALEGEGIYTHRVLFPNVEAYENGVKALKKRTGVGSSAPGAPYRIFSDLVQQAMIELGVRLFHGMEFGELRRMQVDIETHSSRPGMFCDATIPEDRITMISVKDSHGYEECFMDLEEGEAGVLRRLIAAVQERDPDVIEGHNIFNFDLEYILKRCRMHKIKCALGRDGSAPTSRQSRFSVAERTVNYRRFDIFGRHVVDTWHLVQLADISKREMDSYGLKYSAKYYGIARPERVYIPGEEISQRYQENPQLVREYCLDDVRETDGLARILEPSYFYQTRLLPLSFQNCVIRGNATRIDGLLCGEYLRAGAALPSPMAPVAFEGGLTEAAQTGVFRPVWHIDVRSLYPSVILAGKMTPATDTRGVFRGLLEQLRQFRLEAKDAMRTAQGKEREELTALQSSFKILINSFYGYLGFSQGTFNDYIMAREVTARGRDILTTMRGLLEKAGAQVVEMDTDGIYFVPPEENPGVEQFREGIQSALPPGIEVELDGVYAAMFSYKSKNYALREEDGRISLHGAALRSRGLEPFQRRFVQESVEMLLDCRGADLPALYERYATAIKEHQFPLSDFMKRENLTGSVEKYKSDLAAGKGRRSAVYELAVASGREYSPGDSLRYYVTGTKKSVQVASNSRLAEDAREDCRDENIPYYLDKLQSLYEKFSQAVAAGGIY